MGAGALVAVAMFARRKRSRNLIRQVAEVPEVNDCSHLEHGGMCGIEGFKCNDRQKKLSCPVNAEAYRLRNSPENL